MQFYSKEGPIRQRADPQQVNPLVIEEYPRWVWGLAAYLTSRQSSQVRRVADQSVPDVLSGFETLISNNSCVDQPLNNALLSVAANLEA